MTPGPRGRRHHDRPRLGRRPPRDPDPCPGCGRDPWEDDDHPGCEPKDVRGLTPRVHTWPEPTTAEEFDLFADSNPCECGAIPGSYHHWDCGLEVCPFADLHPDDGEQLLCCGCYE
jgi:hypothetical protein